MKTSKLRHLMSFELPNITYQKRLYYRTDEKEVKKLFKLINKEVFKGELPTPKFIISSNCKLYWGLCSAQSYTILNPEDTKSECTIKLMDKWYCKQWLITTLAHEMCHQYQWDIIGRNRMKRGMRPIMSHGPTFFMFREELKKHGIPLKSAHRTRKWFKAQNMFKC